MVDTVYNAINKYFNTLGNTGYVKQKDVYKLLVLCGIEELLNNDFRGLVSQEDYSLINKALYCLYGSTCLIPYPDYYSGKNKRVMYLGSISELACRVNDLEAHDVKQDERLTSAEGRLTSLEGRVDTAEGNISSLQHDVNDINNTVVIMPTTVGGGTNTSNI